MKRVLTPKPRSIVQALSICGNPFYGGHTPICPRCYFAYSPLLRTWSLALEDPSAFPKPLHDTIANCPLPPDGPRSRIVYEQELSSGSWTHAVHFWCIDNPTYLDHLWTYTIASNLLFTRRPAPPDSANQSIIHIHTRP